MKKILISLFIIITSLNFSFAEEGFINSIVGSKKSVIKDVKDFFVEKKEIATEDKVLNAEEQKETTKSEITSTKEIKPIFICENKKQINSKKEKINISIKNQIKDKNKLTDKLLEITSTVSTSSKEIIEEKIIKLDTEVGVAIKIQKNILDTIASSTETICDLAPALPTTSEPGIKRVVSFKNAKTEIKPENKEYSNLNKKILKLELENDKQLEKINNLIKKDIKNVLVEINSTDTN